MALTDNRRRTAAALRHHFSKAGGELGPAVGYLFRVRDRVVVGLPADEAAAATGAAAVMDAAIEAGAEDVDAEGAGEDGVQGVDADACG